MNNFCDLNFSRAISTVQIKYLCIRLYLIDTYFQQILQNSRDKFYYQERFFFIIIIMKVMFLNNIVFYDIFQKIRASFILIL